MQSGVVGFCVIAKILKDNYHTGVAKSRLVLRIFSATISKVRIHKNIQKDYRQNKDSDKGRREEGRPLCVYHLRTSW